MGFLEMVRDGQEKRLARMRSEMPLEDYIEQARDIKKVQIRSFSQSLAAPGISVIAEIKRASPSRGLFAPALSVRDTALRYESAGASAISVLTAEEYFLGSYRDLQEVSGLSRLPVLCKDFIIDPYQVWMAAACGASAALLIARILGPALAGMLKECREAGIESLVEVHSPGEVELAVNAGAKIIGVNCRDLDTLEVDPKIHSSIKTMIPPGIITVAESGIRDKEQVREIKELDYDAVLVGESLVRADDPGKKLRELLGQS